MANLPELRSKAQIVGDLIDVFLAKVKNVNDLNRGSVINQFFNAIGQSNFRAAADIISMVDSLSVDRASGEALQRLAADKDVPIYSGDYASGTVNITDTSFSKISSQIYVGQPAPVAGTLVIYVVDASKFDAAGGKIYIGRGTRNAEGPLTYISTSQEGGGAYWSITLDPSSPTTTFHSQNEEVTFAQGNRRTIGVGTPITTAQGSVSVVNFATLETVYIEDGEVAVTEVPIICQEKGTIGNVPRGAIKEAPSLQFKAVVFNQNAIVNGKDSDTEDDIRTRIKEYEAAKSKGTEPSIKVAAIGVTSPDELKTVRSSETIREVDGSCTLVFDDGSGYEASVSGAGYEKVLSGAVGGETELQLRKVPLAPVRLKTLNTKPFAVNDGDGLRVTIQGVTYTHYFDNTDFRVANNATSYEIVASINGNTNLHFLATTANGGTRVVIFPKDKTKNDIKVEEISSGDANSALGFPVTPRYALLLYKNDEILYQDGILASLISQNKSDWDTSITDGDTLKYKVDGTPEQTITFTNEDFQNIQLGATVSYFADIGIWKQVFNNLMTGVVAEITGEAIRFSSARGLSNDASLEITGGTLMYKIFPTGTTLSVEGQTQDYTLNKNTGQISLTVPLETGDKITAGSPITRANVFTASLPDGPNTGTGIGNMWFIVDGEADLYASGLAGDTRLTFSKTGNEITILAQNPFLVPVGFDSTLTGDWILVWAEDSDPSGFSSWQGFWRVKEASRGRIVVEESINTSRPASTDVFNVSTDRIVMSRSYAPIQKFSFSTYSLSDFANDLEDQIKGIETSIVGSAVRISTLTYGENGELVILAANASGRATGVEIGTIFNNIPAQNAHVETINSEVDIPSFTYGVMGAEVPLDTTKFIDAYYEDLGGSRYDFIEILNRYEIGSEDLFLVKDTNSGNRAFVKNYDPDTDTLELVLPDYMKKPSVRIKTGDRYFLRNSYQFDSEDKVSFIIDGNTSTGTFGVPVARKLIVSGNSAPTLASFSADDAESSLDLDDSSSFSGFDFRDFKVWRQSETILTDGSYAVRIKSSDFGPSGDNLRVGFVYPTDVSSTSLAHRVSDSDIIDIGIQLPVSTPRTPNWDGTSSFTVDVTNISGSKDKILFTWRTGTEPNFLGGGGADVNLGDIAMINSSSDFLPENSGIQAKVTSVTANTFEVEMAKGSAISDNMEFNSISNEDGEMVIVCPSDPMVSEGDRVGIFDTAVGTALANAPMDQTVYVTKVGPAANTFTVATPAGVPAGEIDSANGSANNLIIVNSTAHGLAVGDVVKISDIGSPFGGLAVVRSVPLPDQFSYIRDNAVAAGTTTSGRFDYQSFVSDSAVVVTSISLTSGVATVSTSSAHGFSTQNAVEISGITMTPWNGSTVYSVGDLVEHLGSYYVSLSSGSGNDPVATIGVKWQVTVNKLEGKFMVESAGGSTFTYIVDHSVGSSGATGGSATSFSSYGKLARAIGNLGDYLQFAAVSTTSQEVVDYVTQNMAGLLEATVNSPSTGSETITSSTEDLDISTNYLSGNISNYSTVKGTRLFTILVDTDIPVGSDINIDMSNSYDGKYVVLKAEEIVPSVSWKLTLQSSLFAIDTNTTAVSGTFIGSTGYSKLKDGQASVLSYGILPWSNGTVYAIGAIVSYLGGYYVSLVSGNLNQNPNATLGVSWQATTVTGNSLFTVKSPWVTSPQIGDEIRLVAVTTDHLTRFWNRLVVTGLSNATFVDNSEYGKQIQISTDTFGEAGSVRVTGGKANSANVAIVGSGTERNGRTGVFYIPYDLRKGFSSSNWIKLEQTVRQNKVINLGVGTYMTSYADGFEIMSGAGSFQTSRAVTHDETTQFKVERHGDFTAFIRIGGSALNLGTAGVQEGDWVRIRNIVEADYDTATNYTVGDMVRSSGFNWHCISNNGPSSTVVFPIPLAIWDIDHTYAVDDTVQFNGKSYVSTTNGNTGEIPNNSVNWNLVWEKREWNSGNLGIFQVVRVFGEDAFWVENSDSIEELITLGNTGNLSFYTYDSIMPNDTVTISGSVLGAGNIGTYKVLDDPFPSATRLYTDAVPVQTANKQLGNNYVHFNVEEESPLRLWKKILAIGPATGNLATVIVDSPNLVNRISSSNAAYIEAQGKLSYSLLPTFGIDAYKYYLGLVKELNRVIYGDPIYPIDYPGYRAAGTTIDIEPASLRRISVSLSIRLKTGVSFSIIRDAVRGSIAGYINTLAVGESVSLSKIIESASEIAGVVSVVITYPDYNAGNDTIKVTSKEKAYVVNPIEDILIDSLG